MLPFTTGLEWVCPADASGQERFRRWGMVQGVPRGSGRRQVTRRRRLAGRLRLLSRVPPPQDRGAIRSEMRNAGDHYAADAPHAWFPIQSRTGGLPRVITTGRRWLA